MNVRLDRGQIEVVDEDMVSVLRQKTTAERIRIGSNIWVSAQKLLLAHLRRMHPEWDERKVLQEVARRLSHGAV